MTAVAIPDRPWHATVVMFDAAGETAHEWRFAYRPDVGGVWLCDHPGSMPLDELVDTLAYLHKMSPRMPRITWDEEYAPIHSCAAPQWGLDVAFDDYPPSPAGRLHGALLEGRPVGATWFFPDEVGRIASRHYQATRDLLYWLCHCLWTERALAALRAEREQAG